MYKNNKSAEKALLSERFKFALFFLAFLVPVKFQEIMHVIPAAADHGKGNGKQSRAFGESRLFEEKTAVKKSERNSVRDHDRKINLPVF